MKFIRTKDKLPYSDQIKSLNEIWEGGLPSSWPEEHPDCRRILPMASRGSSRRAGAAHTGRTRRRWTTCAVVEIELCAVACVRLCVFELLHWIVIRSRRQCGPVFAPVAQALRDLSMIWQQGLLDGGVVWLAVNATIEALFEHACLGRPSGGPSTAAQTAKALQGGNGTTTATEEGKEMGASGAEGSTSYPAANQVCRTTARPAPVGVSRELPYRGTGVQVAGATGNFVFAGGRACVDSSDPGGSSVLAVCGWQLGHIQLRGRREATYAIRA